MVLSLEFWVWLHIFYNLAILIALIILMGFVGSEVNGRRTGGGLTVMRNLKKCYLRNCAFELHRNISHQPYILQTHRFMAMQINFLNVSFPTLQVYLAKFIVDRGRISIAAMRI